MADVIAPPPPETTARRAIPGGTGGAAEPGAPGRRGLVRRWRDFLAHVRDPLYQNAYALIANSGLNAVLGLAYWAVAARVYRPDEVGRGSALISALVFVAGIAQLNLRPVYSRFLPVAGRRTAQFIFLTYAATAIVGFDAALIFIVGAPIWADSPVFLGIRSDLLLACLFAGATVLWALFALQDGILIGLRATLLVPLENGLFGLGKLVVLVALAALPAVRSGGIVGSWVGPMIVAVLAVNVIAFGRLIPNHLARHPEPGQLFTPGRIARFVAGDYVGSLFALLYAALLPVLVISQAGPVVGAHFYIVWVIFTSLQLLPLQMVVSLVVETARDPATFSREGRRMLRQMVRVIVPLALGVAVGAPWILEVFGPGYAAQGTVLLRLLALAILPYTLTVLGFGALRARAQVGGIALAQACLAVGILGLSWVLLPSIGLKGVGVGVLVAQTVVALAIGLTILWPALRHRPEPAR